MDDFQEDDFQEDDFQEDPEQKPEGYEGFAQSTLGFMREAGPAILGGYEKYVSAPIRAGVGAAIDRPAEFGGSTRAAYEQFGEDPSKAPTGGQLLEKAGISVPDVNIPTPFQKDLEGNRYQINTKELAGGLAGAAVDPMSYIPVGKAIPGRDVASKAIRNFAEERAAKTALGNSIKAYREAAGVTPRGIPDTQKALQKVRNVGRTVLDDKTIGWASTTENVGEKSSKRFAELRDEFSRIEKAVDAASPDGFMTFDSAADRIIEYANTIPQNQAGKAVKERLLMEADNLRAAGRVKFGEAQDWKGAFPFNQQSPDAFISNKDATNTIRRIIKEEMDKGVAATGAAPDYPQIKKQYGAHEGIASAATDRALMEQKNRWLSPSDYYSGGTAGSIAAFGAGDPVIGFLTAGSVGLVSKLVRERGGAFVAKSADALANIIQRNPQKFSKWQNKLLGAAGKAPNAFVITHHSLMSNDPEYRQAFLSEFQQ